MYAADQVTSQFFVVPWYLVLFGALLWLGGMVHADILNDDSVLRAWLDRIRGHGAFGSTSFGKSYFVPPGADRESRFIDIVVPFVFDRHTDVLSVRITGYKRKLSFSGLNDSSQTLETAGQWEDFKGIQFLKGEHMDLLIARVSIDSSTHSYYGDFQCASISSLEEHLFKSEIISQKRTQVSYLYLRVPYHKYDMAIHGKYNGDRFFLVDRYADPLGEMKRQLDQSPSKRSVWHWMALRH